VGENMGETILSKALKNLKRGFLILSISSLMGLILSLTTRNTFTAETLKLTSPNILLTMITLIVIGLVLFILGLVSWILRIIGWGDLCNVKIKKFYCYTRLALIIFPIIGITISMIGGILIAFESMSAAQQGVIPQVKPSFSAIVTLGSLLFLVGFILEGVSLYDFSLVKQDEVLKYASILYILSILSSAITTILTAIIGHVNYVIGVFNNILQLVSGAALYYTLGKT